VKLQCGCHARVSFNFVSEGEKEAFGDDKHVYASYINIVLTYIVANLTTMRNLAVIFNKINPLKPELNPICYLLAWLGAHHFLHV